MRDIRDGAGNNLLTLPVSTAARVVNGGTAPAGVQQLRASPTGCGIPLEQHAVWSVAFAKISSAPSMPTVQELYRSWARTPGHSSELQRLLRTAHDSDSGPASPGHRRSGAAVHE
ncbi:hypothetical protein EF913_34180 [Streptomyces sp. WAC04189]|uniref:hypothetical protein n=1 Tax=Streptomyces TaxID=1883 RepID=UPI000F9C2F79|nr:hypothetical protein [Streptomyces sp. WAC04189]RSR96249.1 hypothetical protein EF913_34180 [Streptomyces sp. WAC04189]